MVILKITTVFCITLILFCSELFSVTNMFKNKETVVHVFPQKISENVPYIDFVKKSFYFFLRSSSLQTEVTCSTRD